MYLHASAHMHRHAMLQRKSYICVCVYVMGVCMSFPTNIHGLVPWFGFQKHIPKKVYMGWYRAMTMNASPTDDFSMCGSMRDCARLKILARVLDVGLIVKRPYIKL